MHTTTDTPDEKKAILAKLVDNRTGLENRLFFSARNLAIEAMMLRLEVQLLREGFPAKCEWRESSFGSPVLYISMEVGTDASGDAISGTCTVYVARDKVLSPESISGCFYSQNGFSSTEHWPRKQPAKLLKFRERVQELHDSGYLAAEIAKVNYPFEYERHSSF
jgi:hypothetical protein